MSKRLKILLITLLILSAGLAVGIYTYNRLYPTANVGKIGEERQTFDFSKITENFTTEKTSDLPTPPASFDLDLPNHYYQTFNNCGPATLAMTLNYYGVNTNQTILGKKIRPHQNPQGDNDDKATFLSEMAAEAENQGFVAYHRANGDIETLKHLTSNGIPVVVKTWLEPNDDIGHYRIVTGYNESGGYIIQDDSYQGPNRRFNYESFLELWQPFNYQMLVIVSPDKTDVVEAILGSEINEITNWQNALTRAQNEETLQPGNPYPVFNQAVAHYYLGNYQQTVQLFESVQTDLPGNMLWYQLEPIQAYIELGQYETALNHISEILSGGNRAFTELYVLRGEIYLAQGNEDAAREEFETAVFYNQNSQLAREALQKVQ